MSKSKTPPDQPDDEALLGDLESIKSLLDEDENSGTAADPVLEGDDDVPLLEDAIEEHQRGLADSAFKTLLGDTWQESVDDLFGEARNTIEANKESWFPQDTDELANALKVRIDVSVKAWLAETLQANIGELRKHIVADLSAEIMAHMKGKISQPNQSIHDLNNDPNQDPNKDPNTHG